ncbi:DUF6973 domain-containing protein [Nocardia fluminea]|uniref:DUF6973 domain-containing protein n=1 Tax=Nocardia fluminea TaxID=134984 RepID=UPI003672C034
MNLRGQIGLLIACGIALAVSGGAVGPVYANPSDTDIPPGNHQWAACAANAQYCVQGGPVYSARDDAYTMSRQLFPYKFGFTGGDDEQDAARHCIWQALMVKRTSEKFATDVGNAHEADGGDQRSPSSQMDQHNNAIGRSVGVETANQSDETTYSRCAALVRDRTLTVINTTPMPFGSIWYATEIPSPDGSFTMDAFAYDTQAKCFTAQRTMMDSQRYRSVGACGEVTPEDPTWGPSVFLQRGAPVGSYMIVNA